MASSLGFLIAAPCWAQATSVQAAASVGPAPSAKAIATIIVPEWKSEDGKSIVRLRARAQHDFYDVTTNLTGTSNDSETSGDALRGLRVGFDGQFSPKLKFRADANLTDSQFNWVDAYVGYAGPKYEFYVGQHRQSTTFETVGPDVNFPLPETSLVNISFGQGLRSFGVALRVKGTNWQTIGGIYSGNMNSGDMFSADALQYGQVRSTYALRNKDRDVIQIGASARFRDARDGTLLRYASRAAVVNFGPRAIDSGAVGSSDATFSIEALMIRGPLMVTGEYQIVDAKTRQGDLSMYGGYAEASWWLTRESRGYQVANGTVGQVKPRRPLGPDGFGALAVVARFEYLNQSDRMLASRAGSVNAMTAGLSWIPIEYIMLRLAVSQTNIDRLDTRLSGKTNTIISRAQIAF